MVRVAVAAACRKPEQHGPHGRDVDLRFAGLEIRQHALARRAGEADLVAERSSRSAAVSGVELENRRGALALHERHGESRQLAARAP